MNIRKFLKILICKFQIERDLKTYCKQYYAIFIKFYKRKKLNEYTRIR